ncbi:hypothetical protein OBBRIDRAFT_742053, partial [Obba rivulosa]
WPRDRVIGAQLDWVFDSLNWVTHERDPATGIETEVRKTYRSNELIHAELKSNLIISASVLEDVPAEEKDRHPHSNGQVLDLDHPSLYCFRIGQSLIKDADTGRVVTAVVQRFINPLWERVLTDSLHPDPPLAVKPKGRRWYNHVEMPPRDYIRKMSKSLGSAFTLLLSLI